MTTKKRQVATYVDEDFAKFLEQKAKEAGEPYSISRLVQGILKEYYKDEYGGQKTKINSQEN